MLAPVTLPPMSRKPLPESEKRIQVAARVLPSVVSALQALADADRRTLSFMVEEAIREYVERHGKKQTEPKRR